LNAIEVPRAILVSPADLEKLSLSLGLELCVLETIAPSGNPVRSALRRSFTRPSTEAVCPHCLVDASYSRLLWSHSLATACPAHGSRFLDICQRCGKGIRHDRALPHLCDCGADLRQQTTNKATAAEIEFSSLLMGVKPELLSLPFALDGGIPVEIDLFVWGLVNHFGSIAGDKSLPKIGKIPLPESVEQTVERLGPVFELFEEWPSRFDRKLKRMVEAAPATESTGAAARLGRWYFFLFRKYPDPAFQPLRVAAANRIVQSHDGVLNARTHNVQSIATVQKKWYSVKEASVELRVTGERINDGIDRCLIEARIHDEAVGYRQRFLSFEEIERLKQLQFEHINDTAAMEILQVPKAVYSLMCDAGWVTRAEPNDIAPVVSGYIRHVPLLGLIERLRTSAQENKNRIWGEFVRLRDLNLRRTTDLQRLIGLFRSICAGKLNPIGHDENFSIGGLMFSQSEVDERIASWFVARGLTLQQVSALTGAHYDAVKGWVEDGLLPASREPLEQGSPWVIDLHALTTFLLSYTPLATLAKSCKTTSRSLHSRLEMSGITPVETVAGRGALVKLSDLCGTKGHIGGFD